MQEETTKKIRVNIFNKWFYKLKLSMIMSGMDDIDALMVRAGYNRGDRRAFWRAFIQRDKKSVFSVLKKLKI